MSIDHLKKQAKNLKIHLPAFLEKHPNGAAPLSQYQELIALASGYPSWHAAVKAKNTTHLQASADDPGLAINMRVIQDKMTIIEYTKDGHAKFPVDFECLRFAPLNQKLHDEVADKLDDFFAGEGSFDEYGEDGPPTEYNHKLESLCRRLIARDPGFIEAYAQLGNALFWQSRHTETIKVCQPFFDDLCCFVPSDFKGRINYHELENRPFFRLAHTLVLAYYGLNTPSGDRQAKKLAKQMLKWWPNDNIGFRFLLSPSE